MYFDNLTLTGLITVAFITALLVRLCRSGPSEVLRSLGRTGDARRCAT